MTILIFPRWALYLLLVLLALTLAFFAYGGFAETPGALLVTVVFWISLMQGSIALAATTELTNARWIASLRQEMLAVHPLLLLGAVLFLFLIPLMPHYPWADHPGLWLNEPFFIGRNLLLLLAAWFTGRQYALKNLRQDPSSRRWAVIYLFVFATSQSLIGFDLIMSLAYPWISTLFGAFFLVEALYGAIALAGILFFLLYRVKASDDPERTERHQRDVGMLLFGFSVLWGGLFFAQYLLLWYGNLPEETAFIVRRVSETPFRELSVIFIIANFVVPFFLLLSRRVKESPALVVGVSLVVFLGLCLERVLYVMPILPVHSGILFLQNLMFLLVWIIFVHNSPQIASAE